MYIQKHLISELMNENSDYGFSILNCREMCTDLVLLEQEG